MRHKKLDLAALGILIGSAIVVGWPILVGGYLTYMDNPVHLAEILARVSGEAWSEIGFCGFPLTYLHSPIWYGGLDFLVWLGLPAGPLFAAFLLFAALCPPLAIYAVGRRRLSPLVALVPAWLLLMQRTAVVGYGSVFGGMATFFIACGLLIVFVDLLAGRDRSWRQVGYLALTLMVLALTHLYVLVAAVLVAWIHSLGLLLFRRPGWARMLARDAVAYGVAALGSSLYWYPAMRDMAISVVQPQNLPWETLLRRLFLPTDVLAGVQQDLYLLDAVPMTALVLLGVVGVFRASRWPRATCVYGGLLALSLGVILFVLLPLTNGSWLGPNSWRFLFILRIGFALASLAALLQLEQVPLARGFRAFAAVASAMIATSLVLAAPLRSQVGQPRGEAWVDLQETWAYLRAKAPLPGRVFVQDTFMTQPLGLPFDRSHVASLTAHEAGVQQVGAYYGIVPYQTRFITAGEFGLVLGMPVHSSFDRAELRRRIELTNTTHFVIADPAVAELLIDTGLAQTEERFGRYSVMRADRYRTGWVIGDGGAVHVREWTPGHILLDVSDVDRPARFVVSQSFHPGWTVSSGASIAPSPDGLLELSVEGQAVETVALRWKQYRAQTWLSVGGLFTLAMLFGISAPRKSRGRY